MTFTNHFFSILLGNYIKDELFLGVDQYNRMILSYCESKQMSKALITYKQMIEKGRSIQSLLL